MKFPNIFKITLLSFIISIVTIPALKAQLIDGIKWYTFEEAIKLSKETPKKIFVDVYTDWCGWCKKMNQTTFKDSVIIAYMNEKFYPVKFNAEQKDTVKFKDEIYINPPGQQNVKRSTHQFARKLLNGKMSYPSYAFLDQKGEILTAVGGYLSPAKLYPILKYFGDDIYKIPHWELYMKCVYQGLPKK